MGRRERVWLTDPRAFGWSLLGGFPRSGRVLDPVVGAALADGQDAQVVLAVVDELVRPLRAFDLGEEVAGPDAVALVAHVQPAGAPQDEEALLLLAVPVEAHGALPGTDHVEVHADPAQARGAADEGREAERLAAGLDLVLARRGLLGGDEPRRPLVVARDQLLGPQALGLAHPPVAGRQDAAGDPARRPEV